MGLSEVILALLLVASVLSALAIATVKDMLRLVIAFGAFLVTVAALFAYFGQTFLAVAEVFVYVGGILVLFVFAVMLLRRSERGRPLAQVQHDVGAAAVGVGVSAMIVLSLKDTVPATIGPPAKPAGDLARELLGARLVAFELLGALLLIAVLVVVLVTMSEDGERT